jgi:hypothetical protein
VRRFVAGTALTATVTNLVEEQLGVDQALLGFVFELLLLQLSCAPQDGAIPTSAR